MIAKEKSFIETKSRKKSGLLHVHPAMVLVSIGHFINDVFSSFLPIILPLLIDRIELSLFAAGSFTFFFRIPTIFSPLIGRIADGRDLSFLFAIAPAVTGICMSMLGNAPGYIGVSILVFVAGISSAILHVLGPLKIVQHSDPDNYGSAMGIWMLGGESSRAVGPIFAAWCMTVFPLHKLYPVMAIGITVSAILLAYRNRGTVNISRTENEKVNKKSWTKLIRQMVPFSGFIIARAAMVGTLVAFLPTYFVSIGKSLIFGGFAFAVMQCGGIIGTILGGWASDKYGPRKILFYAFLLSGIFMILIVNVTGWFLYPLLVLLGIAIFTIAPIILAILQFSFEEDKGVATGLYTMINFVVTALATLLSGWIADVWGFYITFIFNAVLGVLSLSTLLMSKVFEKSKI